MSLTITPYVAKNAQGIYFFALEAGILENVTGVASQPTVAVNGNAVQIQGPYWSAIRGDLPFVLYQLNCGPVYSVAVQAGGSGYSAPVATVSGGGGSGCKLGAPLMGPGGVITSIPVLTAGSGYTSPPAITITDHSGLLVPMAPLRRVSGTRRDGRQGWPGAVVGASAGQSMATTPVRRPPGSPESSGYQSWCRASSPSGAGSGASAVPVMAGPLSTDTVTYSASANWLTTAVDNAPAASGAAVANYVGQLEPAIGAFSATMPVLPFNLPPNDRTLQVGYNVSTPSNTSDYNYQVNANWMHRAPNPWTNAVTSTPDGVPLTIQNTASFVFDDTNTVNQVDAQQYPAVAGTWTFIADDTAPGLSLTQMTVAMGDQGAAAITGGLVNSGTLTSGVQVGKVWQFVVTRTTKWNMGLDLQFNTAGASNPYPFTLQNMALYSPQSLAAGIAVAATRNTPLLPDGGLTTWLTTPSLRYPASLRFMDHCTNYGGQSNVVDPQDLMQPGSLSWSGWPNQTIVPTGGRTISITAIRTYAPVTTGWPAMFNPITWSSPHVYLAQWDNPVSPVPIGMIQVCNGGSGYTAPTVSWSGGGGSSLVFGTPVLSSGVITSIPITSSSSDFTSEPTITITDANGSGAYAAARATFSPTTTAWLNYGGSGTEWCVGEAVCSANHNLASMQGLNVPSGTGTFLMSNGPTASYAATLVGNKNTDFLAWPTSATTFAFVFIFTGGGAGTGATLPGGLNNVVGTNTVSYTATLAIPDPSVSPFEVGAATAAAFPNCDHYINIPAAATLAASTSIAQRCRDTGAVGTTKYLEYSNENWNQGYSILGLLALGQIGAVGTLGLAGQPNPYVLRASQHHANVVNVFNQTDIHGNTGRGSEIVRVMGSWCTGGVGLTGEIVACANTFNASVLGSIISVATATLWPLSATPATNGTDDHAYELGCRFQAAVAGYVTGVRFYKAPTNTGTHIGHLWSNAGTLLATATFTNETASGWQQANFAAPIAIAATTDYVISYWCPIGNYSYDTGYFASTGYENGNLSAVKSVAPNYNGVYHQNAIAFPASNSGPTNYWVDVVFSPSSQPYVVSVQPPVGTTGVSNFTPVISATFTEAVNPATIVFTLNGGTNVPGTASYNAGTQTATFVPSSVLTGLTVYTASISASDTLGNAMASPFTWTFTTLTPTPIQIDALCVAPYMDMPSEPAHANPTAAQQATVVPAGGGAAGGLLAAGTYFVSYTWIDSVSGMETGIGSSRSAQFTVASGDIPNVTIAFPSPNWTSSANIYLTLANGAAGSEVLYLTGVTATTSGLGAANTGTVVYPPLSRLPSSEYACASIASGWPTGFAFGCPTPWTRPAYLDYFRHWLKYNSQYNGPAGNLAGHLGALGNYVPVAAQPSNYLPLLLAYEGGVEAPVPAPSDTGPINGYYLANALTHDLYYDPEMYNAYMAWFQMCQSGGFAVVHVFNLCFWLDSQDMWPDVIWAGQPAGRGDGSLTTGTATPTNIKNLFWSDTGQAQHLKNASVRLQAWRDWADAANPQSIEYAPLGASMYQLQPDHWRRARRPGKTNVGTWRANIPQTYSPFKGMFVEGVRNDLNRWGRRGTSSRPHLFFPSSAPLPGSGSHGLLFPTAAHRRHPHQWWTGAIAGTTVQPPGPPPPGTSAAARGRWFGRMSWYRRLNK